MALHNGAVCFAKGENNHMMDPLFDFTGKVVLVTGGSRGLGYHMVKAFAERGADVIIASRKLENCEKVAEECRALGRRAMAHAMLKIMFGSDFPAPIAARITG